MVARNWLMGWYIVEFGRNGADRAKYGTKFLKNLSMHLKQIGIKGSSTTRLKLYRSFYLQYKGIRPTLLGEFGTPVPDTQPAIGPAASDRVREYWQQHGRGQKWIQQRMMGQETRNKLTDYWKNGAKKIVSYRLPIDNKQGLLFARSDANKTVIS